MTKPPIDIQPDIIWRRQDFTDGNARGFTITGVIERHREPCDVYWGSHGCCRPHGHDGDHWCDCCQCDDHPQNGCVAGPPYYGPDTNMWGDDHHLSAAREDT